MLNLQAVSLHLISVLKSYLSHGSGNGSRIDEHHLHIILAQCLHTTHNFGMKILRKMLTAYLHNTIHSPVQHILHSKKDVINGKQSIWTQRCSLGASPDCMALLGGMSPCTFLWRQQHPIATAAPSRQKDGLHPLNSSKPCVDCRTCA